MKSTLLIILCLVLTGCASQGGATQSFWSAIFGRKARAVENAEAKEVKAEDKEVTAAQVEIVKTGVALEAAKAEHPDSRPVDVAKRTNANAAALLNHRDPLSVAATDAAVSVAKGLLSQETEARKKAERAQAETEKDNRAMSEELSRIRVQLDKLSKERDAEARNNLALANELRTERTMKYAGMAGSALLGLLAVAYRLNIGRLQTATGEVLAHIQQTHGDEAAKAARSVAGVILHTGEQKGVFKVFSSLTQK